MTYFETEILDAALDVIAPAQIDETTQAATALALAYVMGQVAVLPV